MCFFLGSNKKRIYVLQKVNVLWKKIATIWDYTKSITVSDGAEVAFGGGNFA